MTANLSDSSKRSNFSLPLSTLRIVWLCCCWIKLDWFQFLRFSFWLLSFILFTLAAVFNRSLLESLHFRNYAGFIVWFVVTAVGFSFIRACVFLVFRRVFLKWDMRKWEKRTRIVLKMLFRLIDKRPLSSSNKYGSFDKWPNQEQAELWRTSHLFITY